MRDLIIVLIIFLLVFTYCKPRTKEIPLSNDNCYFEYIDSFGDKGTTSRCLITGSIKNNKMYCGDDEMIVEVKQIKEVCGDE